MNTYNKFVLTRSGQTFWRLNPSSPVLGSKKDCHDLIYQAAQHYAASCSLSLSGIRERIGKMVKMVVWHKDSFKTKKEEKIILIMIKECTKEVMHNVMAHHTLTDAQQ